MYLTSCLIAPVSCVTQVLRRDSLFKIWDTKWASGKVRFCVNIVDQCEACLTLKSLDFKNMIVRCRIIDQFLFVSSWAARIICNQALLLAWSSSSAGRIVPAGLRLGCCPPFRAANWWKRENSPGTNLQGCAYQENRKVKHFQWTGIKIDNVISCWVLTYIRKSLQSLLCKTWIFFFLWAWIGLTCSSCLQFICSLADDSENNKLKYALYFRMCCHER